jgi:Ca2+-binding EF-hand superfamily protein
MRAKHTALVLTAGFLMIPTMSWSQFPGMAGGGDRGAGGPGGGRMGGMGSIDPDTSFNWFSGGKDVIIVDQISPQLRGIFDRVAPMLGLTGNEISREQFRGAAAKAKEMMASGQLNGMSFRSASPGAPGGPGGGFSMPGTMNLGGGGVSETDRRTEDAFRRMDRDEDGNLQYDEMSETLQNDREKYDLNHDGMIDLTEFKAYVAARFAPQDGGAGRPGGPDGPKQAGDDDEKKRPTIIRAGSLPRDFPYAVLDQQGDNDGQVGLYEWKKSGKVIKEFVTMDLNNDGFLTVDEYYRWRKQGEDAARASGSMSMAYGQGGGRPGFGQAQPGMMAWGGSIQRDLPPGTETPGMGGPGSGRSWPGMGGPGVGAGAPAVNWQAMMGNRGGPGGDRGGPGGDRGGPGAFGSGPGGDRGAFGGDRGGPGGNRGGPGGDRGMPGGDRNAPGSGGDRGSFGGNRGAFTPGAGITPGAGMTPPSRFGPGTGTFTPGVGTAPPAIAIPGAPPGGDRGQGGERGNRGQRGQGGEGGGDRQPKGKR